MKEVKRASLVNLTEKIRAELKDMLSWLGIRNRGDVVSNFMNPSKLCKVSPELLWNIYHNMEKESISRATYEKISNAYQTKCLENEIHTGPTNGPKFNCLACQDGELFRSEEHEKAFDSSTPDKHLGREQELVNKLRGIMTEFDKISLVLEKNMVEVDIFKLSDGTHEVRAVKTSKVVL